MRTINKTATIAKAENGFIVSCSHQEQCCLQPNNGIGGHYNQPVYINTQHVFESFESMSKFLDSFYKEEQK